jgi:endo-1,3(4)-beta-glucanase
MRPIDESVGIQSIIISAKEIGERSVLNLNALQAFSATALLHPAANVPAALTFPLLQGMGFVTALANGCTPLIQSSVFFREIQDAGTLNHGDTSKYRIILEDGKTWLLYITVQVSGYQLAKLVKVNKTTIEGPPNFKGTLQVAKLPTGCTEEFYDRSAGAYAFECQISARVNGSQGTYTMTWNKAGSANPLIMYALSHHVSAFTRTTAPHVTPMELQTTTKGMAVGVLADNWQVTQELPSDMSFTPWLPNKRLPARLSATATKGVIEAGKLEVEQDVIGQCNLDSMYFSGKGLGKFAMMAIALHDMAGDKALAFRVLDKLKQAFAIFVNNQQRTPLVYEKSWRGVVSRAGMENAGADFGNGYYNDHHFHYGYFVYAAAVIGYLDPTWLQQGKNRAWVNTLVRDFANPVNDEEFPFFRSFDWFHGHSWAKGLFESGDGKDEESTSEDSFASYALKMWGRISGDVNLEARGNLMLAIQARVFQTYFLMENNNTAQPRRIVPNKVTGITFENKVDHATYFGMNPEYIQGIHIIPLAPPSTLIRTPTFVKEEWEAYFSGGRVDQAGGGWRGILCANLAIIDPRRAYEFFSQTDFDWSWLDGGASRTWLLAWCAALGGL